MRTRTAIELSVVCVAIHATVSLCAMSAIMNLGVEAFLAWIIAPVAIIAAVNLCAKEGAH